MDHQLHKKKTVSALKWNTLNQVVLQVFSMGIGILMMRLIEPSEFGLLGMVTVFSSFMIVVSNFGLSTSLVQKKDIDELDRSTVFYANLAVGILLTLLLYIASEYIATFYNIPKLGPIAKIISILFTTQTFGMIQSTILQRKMDYRLFFYGNLFATIVGASLAIYLAIKNFGVWALVYQQLATSIATTIVLWFLVKWHPRMLFSFERLSEHLKFGIPLLGTNTLNYWSRNADNLLIGKFLGSDALGLYSKAYGLMMLPLTKISGVISSVMMTSFSVIQDDKERIKNIYLKMSRVIAFVTFPMMGILFLTAEPLVAVVFGDKWMGIVPLFEIFAFVGAAQSISSLNGNIFISQGKTRMQFRLNLFSSVIIISAFLIGVQFDIKAVAISYTFASFLLIIPNLYLMGKTINLSLGEIVLNLRTHIFGLVLITLSGIIISKLIKGMDDILSIIIITIYVIIGWILFFKWLNKALLKEMILLFQELKKNKYD